MADMRAATVHDLPGVYRVCLLTGASGEDASAAHADPDLLGHVWAGAYLRAPGAVALVVQDEKGVAGYCLGVPDTIAFEDWVEAHWLPPLRERYPRGSGATVGDAAAIERLHAWPRADVALATTHPAHLHIDLLPRLMRQGWGTRLMAELFARLAAAGAPSVHLGVGLANVRAQAFYERLGFVEVSRDEHTRFLARSLSR